MEQLVEVLKIDLPTSTGVIFPREEVVQAVEEFRNRLEARDHVIPGEWDLPISPNIYHLITPEKVSHLVQGMWIEGDVVKAKIKLLGRFAELAEEGVQFSAIPRVLGEIKNKQASNMRIATVDLLYHLFQQEIQ